MLEFWISQRFQLIFEQLQSEGTVYTKTVHGMQTITLVFSKMIENEDEVKLDNEVSDICDILNEVAEKNDEGDVFKTLNEEELSLEAKKKRIKVLRSALIEKHKVLLGKDYEYFSNLTGRDRPPTPDPKEWVFPVKIILFL